MPKRKPVNGEEMTDSDAVSTEETHAVPGRQRRVVLPLNDDGMVRWDDVSERNKTRFASAISSDPAALEMIGLASEEAPVLVIDRDTIPLLYDTIAMMVATTGRLFLKWPPQLTQFMHYTEEQKEKLKEPTAKVIEKRAPAWLLRNQDLVALGMAFSQCTKEMMSNAIRQYTILVQQERKEAATPPAGNGEAQTTVTRQAA